MKKQIFITVVLILLFVNVKAQQDDLTKHTDFFSSKTSELQKWLDTNSLSTILKYDAIDVQKEKVYIIFTAKDKHNWDRLDSTVQATDGKSLSDVLFKKCVFLMDLDFEQCELEIETMDFFIYVKYHDNAIVTDFEQKMGEISDNFDIEIGDISGLTAKGKTESKYTIEEIKQKLEKSLKDHYQQFEHWWADYKFKSYGIGNSLVVVISNIKGPILSGTYFEKIIIDFEFELKEEKVELEYDWQAKYGSGVFTVYDTDYKDMELKYAEKMKEYNEELKTIIYKAVKN